MYSIDLLDNDLSIYPKASEISRKYFTGWSSSFYFASEEDKEPNKEKKD